MVRRYVWVRKDVKPGRGVRIRRVRIPDRGKLGLTPRSQKWFKGLGSLHGWRKDAYLAIGDITNIRENNDWGSKGNQMLHNYWTFDKLLHKIENKAEEHGIQIDKDTEEYSSRTCPICLDDSKSNCKDRIFLCSFCGYIDNRDLVGAGNILVKSLCGSLESTHWQEILPFGEGQNA